MTDKVIPQYSRIIFNDITPKGFKSNYPFKENKVYIYFGEIPNMPGHCVVMDHSTGKMYSGYHTDHFVELTEETEEIEERLGW